MPEEEEKVEEEAPAVVGESPAAAAAVDGESEAAKKKKKKKKNKSSKVKAPKAAKTKSSAGKSKKQPKQKSAPSKKKPASSSRKAKAAPVMHAAPVAAAPVASRKKNARKAASSDEASSDSSDDNDEDEMTWDQKRELSQDVNDLSEEHLHQVVNIIKKREKGLSGSSDEIEIDFAQLQNSTLRALQEFVASTKNPKKKGKKKNAPLTAAEKEADIQRRLANVNSQLGDNSPSRQPWADDESSRPRSGGVGGQRSSEGDADSVAQAQPVPPKKTATPSSRPSKRPSAPTTSLLVAASSEVPSSNEVVSFDTARRIESGGVPGTPAVELLQATTAVATEDEDIQVENARFVCFLSRDVLWRVDSISSWTFMRPTVLATARGYHLVRIVPMVLEVHQHLQIVTHQTLASSNDFRRRRKCETRRMPRRLNGWKKSVLLQNCDGKRLLNSSDFNANECKRIS
eukprot:m.375318 g.375318  ORF g.375318 m.375318 type:complete len:458 (+) comp16698_c0_seq15:52-1425(+)